MERPRPAHDLIATEGTSQHALRRAVEEGELDRVRRGFYAPHRDLDRRARHRQLIAATVPLLGAGSVLSHASAAIMLGLPVRQDLLDRVWVTRPGGGHGRRGPVVQLRRCSLDADDVTTVDGVAVTTLARTVVDLARQLPYEWGVIGCDAALAAGCSQDSLIEAAHRVRGWPGGRRALSAARFADGASGSPAESLSRVQMERAGIPTPVTQFPVFLNGKLVATADFGWDDAGLVGECDGKVKYGELLRPGEKPEDAVMREKRREDRIREAGYWIVRWGWQEACDQAELARIIRRGLELAPGATRPGRRRTA